MTTNDIVSGASAESGGATHQKQGSHVLAQELGVLEIGQVTPTQEEAIAAGSTIADMNVSKMHTPPVDSMTALNPIELKKYLGAREFQSSILVDKSICVIENDHGALTPMIMHGVAKLYCSMCGSQQQIHPHMYDGTLEKIKEDLSDISPEALKVAFPVLQKYEGVLNMDVLTRSILAILK